MGLATAQRNVATVTVIATQAFDDANIIVMVVVTSIVSMVVLFPTAMVLRKLGTKRAEASAVTGTVRRKAPWV